MNFTEFLESAVHPLYEKEGEIPKCPPGYRFDKELVMCVPKTKKDAVGNNQKEVLESLLNSKSGISFCEEYKEYNLKSHIHGKPKINLQDHIDRKVIRFM